MIFDKSKNYSAIKNQIEETKKQYFINVQNDPGLISSPSEIVDELINNWYLFNEDKSFNVTEFLKTVFKDIIYDKTRKNFSISIGYVFTNNSGEFQQSFNFPSINHTVLIDKKFSTSQSLFSFGYKIFFKKDLSLLSYLDIQASYARGFSEIKDKIPVVYINSETEGLFKTDEYLRNFKNSYKLTSLDSYGLMVAVPLFDLNFIELGAACSFSYNKYLFEPDMYFIYSKYRTEYNSNGEPIFRETISSGAITLNKQIKKEYFLVTPLINFVYNTPIGFGLKANLSYNFINVNFFYNFVLFH
jgi:hypothetical protein